MAFKTRTLTAYASKIVAYGVTLFSLISCTVGRLSPVEVGDGGFLTGDPCSPPCFWGIIPGRTTEADVMGILQEKGVYDSCETWDHRSSGGRKGIRCEGFVIDFTDDVVQGIAFAPSLDITAQEVIARYGEPERVATYALGVHVVTFSASIAYPRICTIVVFPTQKRLPYTLKPSTRVESISYDIDFCTTSYYEANPHWQEWHGYGEYPLPASD